MGNATGTWNELQRRLREQLQLQDIDTESYEFIDEEERSYLKLLEQKIKTSSRYYGKNEGQRTKVFVKN